jgi:uncharacterized protein (DUF2236 family)
VPTVLPSPDEAPALVPSRDSPVWRYSGDARLMTAAAYAILLQVAHPTVGAGVSEHSDFRADPWGRLLRTLDYSYGMVYGGPRLAAEIGARIRELHKHIKGVKPDGEPYHALEPEAYAWVHATLADAIVRGHELFGRRIPPAEIEWFWADWRRQGRLIGVRERDLPEGWRAFRDYFDRMVDERLEHTAAVDEVLESLDAPAPPPLPFMPERVWRVARLPMGRSTLLATAGMLPPRLRERLGIPWSRARERELRAVAAASRAATPLMPKALLNVGPGYLRWRREALDRGEVASPARAPRAVVPA